MLSLVEVDEEEEVESKEKKVKQVGRVKEEGILGKLNLELWKMLRRRRQSE